MSAQRVTRLVVNAGLHTSEVREFIDDDGALQARAAADLIDVLGIKPSKSVASGSGNQPVTVQVAFVQRPDAAKAPKMVARARVIDA
jgi:hypothetical protein